MGAFTVAQAGQHIAERTRKPASLHCRQIRDWMQRGLIRPVGLAGRGRTAAQLLDSRGVLTASALAALVGVGVGPRTLANAARTMAAADGEARFLVVHPLEEKATICAAEDVRAQLGAAAVVVALDTHRILS